MTTVRRFLLGLMLTSMGAAFPTVAYADEPAKSVEPSGVVQPSISRAVPLDIEQYLPQSEEESLVYEHVFSGYENEIVVAYWETPNSSTYDADVVLYDAAEQVMDTVYYPRDIVLDEMSGRNRAFRLPATGEYRFVFMAEDKLSLDSQAEPTEYKLRLRVASFYERAMMLAIERLEDDRFVEARAGFEMAMAQRPESPMPYLGRLITVNAIAVESSALNERESFTLDGVSQLFQDLDAEEQSVVISDIQQVINTLSMAVERGTIAPDEFEMELVLLGDLADYLKTGEASEALREAME